MAAGTAYSKRYAGGFTDGSAGGTPIDSTFLNAEEAALLQLIGVAPTADGQVAQWDFANTRFGPALLLNKNIDPAAAIAKSKLDFTGANGIVNADIAGGAAIAKSKLAALGIVDADVAVGAAIQASKISGLPTVYRKTTPKTVSNTIVETDLLNGEITIAANVMGATGMIRGTLFVDMLNNATANTRWRLKLGAQTLIDSGANFAPSNNASRMWLEIGFEIANTATGAQNARMRIWMPAGLDTFGPTVGTSGGGGTATPYHFGAIGAGTVDTTAGQVLALTVQHSLASASQDAKLYNAAIEVF